VFDCDLSDWVGIEVVKVMCLEVFEVLRLQTVDDCKGIDG